MPPTHVLMSPVVVNGVMYFWAAQCHDTLIPFDLESEKWKKVIEAPEKLGPWRKTKVNRIAELNDTLCLCRVQSRAYGHQYTNIWILANKDQWIKTYTVGPTRATYPCTPLRVTLDGKLIFHCFLKEEGLVVRVYDPRTKKCKTLWKLDASVHCIDRKSVV